MRIFLLTVLLMSCAPVLPLDAAKCPCSDGWVCCPGLQVCAPAESQCDEIPGPAVTPAHAELGVSRKLRFEVAGENTTWELEEGPSGGSIEADGTYHAPAATGVFHLIARSTSGARRVPVSVRDLRLSVLAGEHGGPSELPVDGIGENARMSNPFGGVLAGGWYYFGDQQPLSRIDPTVSFSVLRRFDPVTRRVETIGGPVPIGPMSPFLQDLRPFVTDHALVLEWPTLFDLDGRTGTKTPLVDLTTSPLLSNAGAITGDEHALYAAHNRGVIVRYDRETKTERVLSGVLDTYGDQDGAPGLITTIGDLLLDNGKLYFVDQRGTSLRSVDLATGAITTLERELPQTALLCATRASPLPSPLAVGYNGWVKTGGSLFATGCASETTWTWLTTGWATIGRFAINAGVSEVLAGRLGGTPGLDDGKGDRARFVIHNSPPPAMHRDVAWYAEPLVRRIRTISHDGEVTTRFRDVEATSLAVSDTFVYATIDDRVQRAPLGGGDWQPLNGTLPAPSRLLGTLHDGRVVAMSRSELFFIDPQTFTPSAPIASRPGPPYQSPALDPSGGVLYEAADGIRRLDLATSQEKRLAPLPPEHSPDLTPATLALGNGRLYAIRGDERVSIFIAEFDPTVGAWVRLVGQPRTGAVVPGPVGTALVHRPSGLGVFENGDVLVPDSAENVMLIIE